MFKKTLCSAVFFTCEFPFNYRERPSHIPTASHALREKIVARPVSSFWGTGGDSTAVSSLCLMAFITLTIAGRCREGQIFKWRSVDTSQAVCREVEEPVQSLSVATPDHTSRFNYCAVRLIASVKPTLLTSSKWLIIITKKIIHKINKTLVTGVITKL